jgi:hypothetical protein
MLGGGSRNAGAQENRTRCTQREVLARSHEQESADFFELHRDAFERPRRSCDARRLPNSCRACGEPQDSRSLAGHAREQGDWPGRSHESVTASAERTVAHVRDEVRQIAESGAILFVVEAASAE